MTGDHREEACQSSRVILLTGIYRMNGTHLSQVLRLPMGQG